MFPDNHDPLVAKHYQGKSMRAERVSYDDVLSRYSDPWLPAWFSRLEDNAPAASAFGYTGIYDDDDLDRDPVGGIWFLTIRPAVCVPNAPLGTLRLSGSLDGDLTASID